MGVSPTETAAELLLRVQQRLAIPDAEFGSWALYVVSQFGKPSVSGAPLNPEPQTLAIEIPNTLTVQRTTACFSHTRLYDCACILSLRACTDLLFGSTGFLRGFWQKWGIYVCPQYQRQYQRLNLM